MIPAAKQLCGINFEDAGKFFTDNKIEIQQPLIVNDIDILVVSGHQPHNVSEIGFEMWSENDVKRNLGIAFQTEGR